jgi:hypothetical protein
MKRPQNWNSVVWSAWGLLSVWMLGFSSPANLAERIPEVLAVAVLVFAAIVVLAPEVRTQPTTAWLGLALLAAIGVLDVSTPAAVASSALTVAALVVGLGIWAALLDPLFFVRVRNWRTSK